MQSNAPSVSAYLDEVPDERKSALLKLRELCCTILTDFEESMQYGMPVYTRAGGEGEVAFASQKDFIAIYILRTEVMDQFRDLLRGKGISLGKGCIRYSKPERIDFGIVEKMLRATQETRGKVC